MDEFGKENRERQNGRTGTTAEQKERGKKRHREIREPTGIEQANQLAQSLTPSLARMKSFLNCKTRALPKPEGERGAEGAPTLRGWEMHSTLRLNKGAEGEEGEETGSLVGEGASQTTRERNRHEDRFRKRETREGEF